MSLDERVFVWSAQSITVDGNAIPRDKQESAAPTWGTRSPALDDILAGKLPEPEPGVRVLAAILARALFQPKEREQHFEGLCRYLATLPPPDVMPEVRIRGNELRQHAGVPIMPEPLPVARVAAPAEPAATPPPETPPPPHR